MAQKALRALTLALLPLFLVAPDLRAQSEEKLRAHITYLSSSALDGRGTPSAGLELAADYIADQFKAAGLDDTRFQPFQIEKAKIVRNVVGLLRARNQQANGEYLVLSAHYDHLGHRYPGANDDASGVASMIEIASALARRPERLRRGVVFIAFAGEELGLLGSNAYVSHPPLPLEKAIAAINLEQLGRTDDSKASYKRAFSLSGWRLTNLEELLKGPALSEGIRIFHRADVAFFDRSDNFPFALRDVPSTTIVTAFDYPDYHKTTDVASKIDYPNLAAVDRAILAGLIAIAEREERPVWLMRLKSPAPPGGGSGQPVWPLNAPLPATNPARK